MGSQMAWESWCAGVNLGRRGGPGEVGTWIFRGKLMQNQFIIISPKRTVTARLAAHFQRHSDLAHSDLNYFPRTTKSIRETGRLSRIQRRDRSKNGVFPSVYVRKREHTIPCYIWLICRLCMYVHIYIYTRIMYGIWCYDRILGYGTWTETTTPAALPRTCGMRLSERSARWTWRRAMFVVVVGFQEICWILVL